MRVAICGGGVIGAATALFLSRSGAEVVVIERTGVANAASGKAGGFLALDWCDGSALAPLARRSFALHEELANTVAGDWGYRRLDTLAVVAQPGLHGLNSGGLAWLGPDTAVRGHIGTVETTAQVIPRAFTQGLMRAAQAHGTTLRAGTVSGLTRSRDDSTVTGVTVDGVDLAADAVVIAMGPWSLLACEWLPLPPVYGVKGHSIVVRPEAAISAHALFVELATETGDHHTPEIYPRPDGSVYFSGFRGHDPLPVDPAEVAPEDGAEAALQAMTAQISGVLDAGETIAVQACYRPTTVDGLPLLGAVDGVAGAYVATGHSVWGILNAPASGEAMAELILDGSAATTDLTAFDPARMAPAAFG